MLQLNSCREHWIQAEISLHAWFKNEVDIWTDLPLGEGRKGEKETSTGKRLRNDEWVEGRESVNVDMGYALIRIWAL